MKRLLLCLYLILFAGDKLMFAQEEPPKEDKTQYTLEVKPGLTTGILVDTRAIPRTDTVPSILLISSRRRHSISRTEDGYCIRRQYFDTWLCVGHYRLDKKGRLITTPYKVWGCERGGKP